VNHYGWLLNDPWFRQNIDNVPDPEEIPMGQPPAHPDANFILEVQEQPPFDGQEWGWIIWFGAPDDAEWWEIDHCSAPYPSTEAEAQNAGKLALMRCRNEKEKEPTWG
jgi:hypothetical protein